eukprot:11937-Hanusia_phi.AAC.1
MAAKRGGGGGGGAAATAAERIQGDPCDELGQGPAKRATPDSDQREARLAREAQNKVNESSADREAWLAHD